MAKEDILLIGFPSAVFGFAVLGAIIWFIYRARKDGWLFFLKKEEEADVGQSSQV